MNSNIKKIVKNKKIFKLKNGIKILIIPMNTKLTNLSISILLGKLHEKKNELELTHFIEHLFAFYTSKKYKNSYENQKELNKRGAYTNAFVSKYITQFYIEGLFEDIEYFVDLMSNTLNNFHIDSDIIIKEKNAIIQELNSKIVDNNYIFYLKIIKYLDNNYSYLYDTKKHINFLNKYVKNKNYINKLYEYYKKHILLKNILLSVICPFNKIKYTIKLLKKSFNFNKKENNNIKYPIIHYNNNINKIIFIKNKIKNNNVILNIIINKKIKLYSTKHLSLNILDDILFNFQTGIFYMILRKELGLIYNINLDINIDNYNYSSSSYSIYTETQIDKLPELIYNIFNIIKNLIITKEQIKIAIKNLKINSEYQNFFNLNTYTNYYGQLILYKLPIINKDDIIKLYNKLSDKDIYNELEEFKKDIFNNSIFFYYSNININKNIKKKLIKNNILHKIKYISI